MFKFKIEGDKVEDLLTVTKGTQQKESNTHKCIFCGSDNLISNGQMTFGGMNGQNYTVTDYHCPTCGLNHQR